jgi:cellulose synthase/poly-beta-1,6-N-acetylglucosamine synthase-like glycosyltransferase
MASKQWLGILQRFEHMIGYRSKKFYSLTNSEFIIGGVASTYRTKVLKRAGLYDTDTMTEDIGLSLKLIFKKGNRRHRIVYAADVVAITEGVETFRGLVKQRYRWKMGNLQNLFKYRKLIGNLNRRKYSRMLTAYRLPMAVVSEIMLLLEPLLLGYVIYLSLHYHTLGILLGAYVTLTAYILWAVWPDEHLTNRQKAQMSVLALGMYVLFYTMDLIQLSAAFRCLTNQRTIRHRDGEQTWVSPLRSGRAATSTL